ncbi:MAG: NAD(P)H-hydrate dehydratase [Spirochaetes bacterium]|nr:NAD(P)H-hydrate dehydratase [Spirochaetota bacterium]
MKVVTAQQMQEIDRLTIQHYGIPGEVLMALAGKSVAEYILNNVNPESVAVFCGVGNNGGDGFVAAYLLSQHKPVEVFVLGNIDKLTPSSKIYYDVCKQAGIQCILLSPDSLHAIDIKQYHLIVDALTGTGFSGQPKGVLQQVINFINQSGRQVVAIDMPSGLPADGPIESDVIVNAHTTITMGLPKVNLVTYPGKHYAGNIVVADIGFPAKLLTAASISRQLIDKEFFNSNYRPNTFYDLHKGTNGHLLCIGGFNGMEGAIMLCAEAAFASGIGLVRVVTTAQARSIIAGKIKEAITQSIDIRYDGKPFSLDMYGSAEFEKTCNRIKDELESIVPSARPTACVIGPGMGRNIAAAATFVAYCAVAFENNIPTIIDGDGLYFVAQLWQQIKLPQRCIVTPHFKEAARIIKKPVEEIIKNRVDSAEQIAQQLKSVVVLKGPATIVASEHTTAINTTGNPALATGGSGDVLAGCIGSFLSKGYDAFVAASLGVYIHGKAADIYCAENCSSIMKAGDIVEYIRKALKC